MFTTHGEDGRYADSIAVVPGIFFGPKDKPENSHAFIFVNVNGKTQHYYRFATKDFRGASSGDFSVNLAGNYFSESEIVLDLVPKEGDDASISLKGELTFEGTVKWPITCVNPGVMGITSWLPMKECNHGVVSLDHKARGTLVSTSMKNSGEVTEYRFTSGRGYIEKDWGYSFPSCWVWFQTNYFPRSVGTSLFFSVARVPYLCLTQPGFICAFLHKGELYKFCSWTLATFEKLDVDEDKKTVHIELCSSTHKLIMKTNYRELDMVPLYGPIDGKMALSVPEALQAKVFVELEQLSGKKETLFRGEGLCGGLEVQGDIQYLSRNLSK